jgi:formylmethanofuran:tetrahydromethanopterin formyltransferase
MNPMRQSAQLPSLAVAYIGNTSNFCEMTMEKFTAANGEAVFKIKTEQGATGYIPESVPPGAVEGYLKQIVASQARNFEEIRKEFGEEDYQRVLADPTEAERIIKSIQDSDRTA